MNRRSFLQEIVAAGAAPLLVPVSVLGAEAPSKRINVGMIGCGRWGGRVNLKPFLEMPDVRVRAVCDVDRWRLEQAKRRVDARYGNSGCRAFHDFRDLLANKDIDAVMVSTCDHWHVPAALAAVRAGKDVDVEKPIEMSIREGRILANEAKRLGRVTRNDSEARGTNSLAMAAEAVLNGRIGRLRRIFTTVPAGDVTAPPCASPDPVPSELDYDLWLGPNPVTPYIERQVHKPETFDRPYWMRVLGRCDGMITNWGAHINDVAQMAMGTSESGPVWIKAKRWTLPPRENLWNVPIDFDIDYRYASGVEMNYRVEKSGHAYIRFEGDNGFVQATFAGLPKGAKAVEASSPAILEGLEREPVRLPRTADKRDFIDCVKSRKQTMEDVEFGHRTCSMCELAFISIQLGGRAIEWDPAKETSPDKDVMRLTDRPEWRGNWI